MSRSTVAGEARVSSAGHRRNSPVRCYAADPVVVEVRDQERTAGKGGDRERPVEPGRRRRAGVSREARLARTRDRADAPAGETRRTRAFPVSAMSSSPFGRAATPRGNAIAAALAGPLSPAKPLSPVPTTVVIVLSGDTRRMRLLPMSSTTKLPSGSAATPWTRSSSARVAGPPSPPYPRSPVPTAVEIVLSGNTRRTMGMNGWANTKLRSASTAIPRGWLIAAAVAEPPSPVAPSEPVPATVTIVPSAFTAALDPVDELAAATASATTRRRTRGPPVSRERLACSQDELRAERRIARDRDRSSGRQRRREGFCADNLEPFDDEARCCQRGAQIVKRHNSARRRRRATEDPLHDAEGWVEDAVAPADLDRPIVGQADNGDAVRTQHPCELTDRGRQALLDVLENSRATAASKLASS